MTIHTGTRTTNRIEGATDGTEIGNVGDRLKVNVPGGSIPSERVVPAGALLINVSSSSADMDVNGSGTNVVFEGGPSVTDEIWYLTRISVALDDTGNSARDDFGAITGGLTNGLLLQMDLDSTTYNINNITNNSELIQSFENSFRGQSTAFINDANYLSAIAIFSIPIILKQSTSDKVKVTVRDNLTGLDLLRITLFYFRVVS